MTVASNVMTFSRDAGGQVGVCKSPLALEQEGSISVRPVKSIPVDGSQQSCTAPDWNMGEHRQLLTVNVMPALSLLLPVPS